MCELLIETFYCKKCNYKTNKINHYNKHMLTKKHIEKMAIKENQTYKCSQCSNEFNSRSTLWRHKKACVKKEPATINTSTDLLVELVKQNKEFKQMIAEQNQKITDLSLRPTIIQNVGGDVNCTKTKFNLNFFLNEQCKDALNITDFVNSLKLQLTDLENTGKNGFVQGISQIFIRGLKELDIYKRPIHCSDFKREIMYVKEENKWEKEDNEDKIIKKAIYKIANKNMQQIQIWVNENPNCGDYYSKKNDQYLNILNECMGGIDDLETQKYYDKIKKNVSKEVIIN